MILPPRITVKISASPARVVVRSAPGIPGSSVDISGKANLAGGNEFVGNQEVDGNMTITGDLSASNLSGTNTGDQTSIVGISGTMAQFNTALTDANFQFGTDFASSKVIHVSKSTSATDVRTGLEKCDPNKPFATLAAAVAAAASGDLILVGPGTYNSAATIGLNGVSVVGSGKLLTVFTNTLFTSTGTVFMADLDCRGGPSLRDSALIVTGGNFLGRNLHLDTRPQGGWDSAFTQGASTIANFYHCFFASDFDGVISGAGQGGSGYSRYYDCEFVLSNPAHPAQPGHVKSLYASGNVEVFGGRFLSSTNAIGGSFDVEVAENGTLKLNGPSLLGLTATLETLGTLTGTYTDSNGDFHVVGDIAASNLSGTNTGDQTTITGNAGSATVLQTGRTIAMTGDVAWTSGSFNGSANVTGIGTLASVNSNVGQHGSSTSIPQIIVDAKGRITSVSGQSVIAPAGTLTGTTLASNVVTSSIATLGNLTGLNVLGNTVLGDGTGNTIIFNGRVASNLVPSSNNTYDLGSTGNRWKDGWFAGALNVDGQTKLSSGQAMTASEDAATLATGDARWFNPYSGITGNQIHTKGSHWGSSAIGIMPFLTGRPDSNVAAAAYSSSPPDVKFIPFFIRFATTVNNARIKISSGTHATYVIRGALYSSDANGFPLTRVGSAWTWSAAATGDRNASTGGLSLVPGLYWVALQCEHGQTTWGAACNILGYSSGSAGQLSQILGLYTVSGATGFDTYNAGSYPFASAWTSMPSSISSAGGTSISTTNQIIPAVLLY